MKLSKTKQTIDAYADGLEAAGGLSSSAILRTIASFLDEFPGEQMSTLVRRGLKVALSATTQKCASENSPCADAAAHLDRLATILASGDAKSESIEDLANLGKLLRGSGESETVLAALRKLRDAMKPEPVEQQIDGFIERLKKETGTPSFDHTFAELAVSPLKREHVVAIAASVYGGIRKNTSRRRALDYIRKPHDAYISAKRGIDATGGRSAA